jgi:hypothetical protein
MPTQLSSDVKPVGSRAWTGTIILIGVATLIGALFLAFFLWIMLSFP